MRQHTFLTRHRLNRCLSNVGYASRDEGFQFEHASGKSASKVGSAIAELQYLNFNFSIIQSMAKAMGHLSDFAFVSMANMTLLRRDSYLAHVKSELKQDSLAALRQAPLDLPTLFPDPVLRKAEEDVGKFEDRARSCGQSAGRKESCFQPYRRIRLTDTGSEVR